MKIVRSGPSKDRVDAAQLVDVQRQKVHHRRVTGSTCDRQLCQAGEHTVERGHVGVGVVTLDVILRSSRSRTHVEIVHLRSHLAEAMRESDTGRQRYVIEGQVLEAGRSFSRCRSGA